MNSDYTEERELDLSTISISAKINYAFEPGSGLVAKWVRAYISPLQPIYYGHIYKGTFRRSGYAVEGELDEIVAWLEEERRVINSLIGEIDVMVNELGLLRSEIKKLKQFLGAGTGTINGIGLTRIDWTRLAGAPEYVTVSRNGRVVRFKKTTTDEDCIPSIRAHLYEAKEKSMEISEDIAYSIKWCSDLLNPIKPTQNTPSRQLAVESSRKCERCV